MRLNQKHKITLVYDTVPGAESVGGVVLDLLSVMKEFDPKYVGFHWDTGHMALHGDGMWETLMRLAGPYIAAVGWRDRGWVQDLGLLGEGGPYAGPYPRVEPLVTHARWQRRARDAAAPGAAAAPVLAAGRAAVAVGAAAGRRVAEDDGAPQGRRGGRGAGAWSGQFGGRRQHRREQPALSIGRRRDAEAADRRQERQRRRAGARRTSPMGMGVVHIPRVATVLAEIGFNGPSELQSEYAGIGGAESGADKITTAAPVRHRHAEARCHHDSQVVRDGQRGLAI